MLGKLFKNEFKSSAHSILNIYLAAVITIGVMLLSYVVKIKWISTLSTIALLLIGGLAIIITVVAVISNFYKSLYGAQGYLSFTLPVKSGHLLLSKAAVSFAWILLSYIIFLGIIIGVYFYSAAMVGQNTIETVKTLVVMFGLQGEQSIKELLVLAGVMVFVQIAVFIAEVYFSITLANTRVFQKIGMVSAIFIFFAVFIVMQILVFLLTSYVPVTLVATAEGLQFSFEGNMLDRAGEITMGVAGFVFEVLAAAGLFAATARLMKTKINVK